jgi:hypothetical protein
MVKRSHPLLSNTNGPIDCTDLEGIKFKRDITTPYHPQQNGVAKRKKRSIVEIAKSDDP